MKKITKTRFALIISMFFMIAVISCEKEEPAVEQDDLSAEADQELSGTLIRVTGHTSGGGTTKTTLEGLETHWIADTDKVGIYSPEALPPAKGETGVKNAEFTAQTSGKSSEFEGNIYWGFGLHDFYAYYPYDGGNDSEPATAVSISLASEQTQSGGDDSDHIGALDFLVATPVTGVSPPVEPDKVTGVNFRYNHVFTLLEFKITGTGTLTKVKLSGPGTLAFGDGTIDITQGTPDKGVVYTIDGMGEESGEVTVDLGGGIILDSDEAVSVYMMINPGEHSGDMAIGLEIGGDYTYMLKSPPDDGFERGKKYEVPVNSGDFAKTVTFIYRGVEVTYGIVLGAKGRLWMDRNLGASQVATASDDHLAYGDLYQWGRLSDGHEIIKWTNSTTGTPVSDNTSTTSSTDDPGHSDFITTGEGSNYDWRWEQNPILWQGDGGTNDVCPAGWRVPTNTELNVERLSWSSANAAGAFDSPLKLPVAGFRANGNGSLSLVGSRGFYWSSTVDGSYSRLLFFTSSNAGMRSYDRATGFSVRCLKDDTSD